MEGGRAFIFEGVMGKYIVARGRWKGVYFEDVMGK